MGKISIYIRLVDGKLVYRDCEHHQGAKIETEVNPGDKILWTLDKNPGIIDISGINIEGTFGFFSKGPAKKSRDKWTAKVAKKIKGEVKYTLYCTSEINNKNQYKTSLMEAATAENVNDEPDPPIIKTKP